MMASLLPNQDYVPTAPDHKALPADFASEVDDIRGRLAAAPPDKAWRVALDIVDVERWPQKAGSMVVASLMQPGMVCTGANMCVSLAKVLSQLQQCISVQYAELPHAECRAASLASAPAQLQCPDLTVFSIIQNLYTHAQQQHQRQRDAQQSGSSSCALGHGPDCPVVTSPNNPTPAPAAALLQGAGPPCCSCQLAHAELLAACSALLRYWPECVLDREPAVSAWVGAAAEHALQMLQDVSAAILQHQQLHADGAGSPRHQQPAPPADVLQPGLAALDLLAAVCYAAAYPDLCVPAVQRAVQRHQVGGVLDLPCMLPSMLAVGAGAVLGQEMQRRLCRTAVNSAVSGSGVQAGSGAGSAAAGAVDGCGADVAAPDATALKDQSSQHGQPAACTPGSSSSKGTGDHGAWRNQLAVDAAWQLVRVTEQWAGGQLLPELFAPLLEALGCHPQAFLLLACVWQQQQQLPQAGSRNPQDQQDSSLQPAPEVLANLLQAYDNVFLVESQYSRGLSNPSSLLQRLSCCHARGQHQPQHTQQHLSLALLLMRESAREGVKRIFQSTCAATPWGLASYPSHRTEVLCVPSAAAACVSTWLCWAQFEWQQQQEEPAAAGGAAASFSWPGTVPSQLWDLGGESSSAVVLEVLRGHCLLLKEGVGELQTVFGSWAEAYNSRERTSSDSDNSLPEQDINMYPAGKVAYCDQGVARILNCVWCLLRALLAAAAVDSGVLQQAAPQLFGLAGTLEQLVRVACACHSKGLVTEIDRHLPQLLQILLGAVDPWECATLGQDSTVDQTQPLGSKAASAACQGVLMCGLLPYLALGAPLGGQQQRRLLGLLFSALKMFSMYPAGLCASLYGDLQENWLVHACDTLRAACGAGRLLLVKGGLGDGDVVTGTPGCSHVAGCSAEQHHKQRQDSTSQGAAGGQGSRCHSCGLGADGMGALLPWVVLQGRALQLWVALLRAYVQLPPCAHAAGSKAGAKGSKGARSSKAQDSDSESDSGSYSLVGSTAVLNQLAGAFEEAVAPSTQLLAFVLQEVPFEGQQCLVEQVYGVPRFLWPCVGPAQEAWLQQQLTKSGQQLRSHCREQGLELSRLEAASASAGPAAQQALLTVMATSDSMKQLGDSAHTQHRQRQSDIRHYLKSWKVEDPAVVKGVQAMLSGGERMIERSAFDVAVAAWLCSPNIAGDQLQEFSSQLSTLPIHEACNNPACTVTAGSREQGLVNGKSCVCAGCRIGHYCSRACQREHWRLHQLQCGAVARKRMQ